MIATLLPSAPTDKEVFMQPDARKTVWEYYNEAAEDVDRDLTKDWDVALDVLLIFAALFSAILASFTVESYARLQPDNEELLLLTMLHVSAQLAGVRDEPIELEKFVARPVDVLLNVFLFWGLAISIVVAMGAMIVKQWVRMYDSGMQELRDPAEKAKVRHRRYEAAFKWRLPKLVGTLHICMMISLLMFYAGLCIMVYDHPAVFSVVVFVFGTGLIAYVVPTMIAVYDPYAPFRSSISRFIIRLVPRLSKNDAESPNLPPNQTLRWRSMEWLARRTPVSPQNAPVICAIVGALGDYPRSWYNSIREEPLWSILFKFLGDNENFQTPAIEIDRRNAARCVLPIFQSSDYNDREGGPLISQFISLLQFSASASVEDQWAGFLMNMQLCRPDAPFLKKLFERKNLVTEPLLLDDITKALDQQRSALTSIIPTLALAPAKRDSIILDLAQSQHEMVGRFAKRDHSTVAITFSDITELCKASHHVRPDAIELLILLAWHDMGKVPTRYQRLAERLPRRSLGMDRDKREYFECLNTIMQGKKSADKGLQMDDETRLRKEFTKLLPAMIDRAWFESPSNPLGISFRHAANLLLYALMPSFPQAASLIRSSVSQDNKEYALNCVKECITPEMSPKRRECLSAAWTLFDINGVDLRGEKLPALRPFSSSDFGELSPITPLTPPERRLTYGMIVGMTTEDDA